MRKSTKQLVRGSSIVALLALAEFAMAGDLIGFDEWLKPNAAPPTKPAGGLGGSNVQLFGRWIVGNGGDSLRLNMAQAKEHASTIISKLTDRSLKGADQDIREFIAANRLEFSADIMASPHVWDLEQRATCAWTKMPDDEKPSPEIIYLSFPTCRDNILSYSDASMLLIHESAHHFHKDEDFADRLALAAITAWQKGALEWLPTAQSGAPSARQDHSAVFDSDHDTMIVYGGIQSGEVLKTGAIYDVKRDSWRSISSNGAVERYKHMAFYYKGKMFVWGGYSRDSSGSVGWWQHTGAIYDIESNSWKSLSAPYGASQDDFYLDESPVQSGVLVGSKVFIWGGQSARGSQGLGAIFDMETESWSMPSSTNAPTRLAGHSVVEASGSTKFKSGQTQLSGPGVIVWGGYVGKSFSERSPTAKGAYYNFASNTWSQLAVDDSISERYNHGAVWTGDQMVVFSGNPSRKGSGKKLLHATGAIYDLKTDKWTALTSQIGVERSGHTMIWDGKEVLIMGGKSRQLGSYYSDVVAFDPDSQTWRSISGKLAPDIRSLHSAVWTGSAMVVWGGGQGFYEQLNSGAIFYP